MKSTSITRIEWPPKKRSGLGTALFPCGIVRPILGVKTDVVLVRLWRDRSYVNQRVIGLSKFGAPKRSAWIAMSFVFNLLVAAFRAVACGTGSRVYAPMVWALVLAGGKLRTGRNAGTRI